SVDPSICGEPFTRAEFSEALDGRGDGSRSCGDGNVARRRATRLDDRSLTRQPTVFDARERTLRQHRRVHFPVHAGRERDLDLAHGRTVFIAACVIATSPTRRTGRRLAPRW